MLVNEVHATGDPGLGTDGAARQVGARIERELQSLAPAHPFVAAGIGVAGALAAPAEAAELAACLTVALHAPVAVTSDVIAAHVGAFGGGLGVLLITGTGAAAVGVGRDDTIRRRDGWGPEVGDLGGGAWIGREVLRAVLSLREGRGTATELDAMVRSGHTTAHDPARWIAEGPNPARRLAAFAPLAIDAAVGGDSVAAAILEQAVLHLADTAAAAAGSAALPIAIVGGLSESAYFRQALLSELSARSLETVAALGSPLDGARILATRTGLPHERHIHRAS
jgi:glucosamine kinase